MLEEPNEICLNFNKMYGAQQQAEEIGMSDPVNTINKVMSSLGKTKLLTQNNFEQILKCPALWTLIILTQEANALTEKALKHFIKITRKQSEDEKKAPHSKVGSHSAHFASWGKTHRLFDRARTESLSITGTRTPLLRREG